MTQARTQERIATEWEKEQIIQSEIDWLLREPSESRSSDYDLEVHPGLTVMESKHGGVLELPGASKSLSPAYKNHVKTRALKPAYKLVRSPKPMFECFGMEHMREHNYKVELSGVFTTPATHYMVKLTDGTVLEIPTARMRRLLHDHTVDTIFHPTDIGQHVIAVLEVPRHLLLDAAE